MPSNTLSGINLSSIADQTLEKLSSRFFILNRFARDFSTDIRDRGASVKTRIPGSVSAVNLNNGYTAQNSSTTEKVITLSNYQGYVVGLKDKEVSLAKSYEFIERILIGPAIEATVKKLCDDLLALVTAANFPSSITVSSSSFDADNLADAASTLSTNKVGKSLRSALIGYDYESTLMKDVLISNASSYASPEPIQDHTVRSVHGIGVTGYEGIPSNGENLEGIICHPSALIIAARTPALPIGPRVEAVNRVTEHGLPIQFRRSYDRNNGLHKLSVGVLYGISTGVSNSLIRLKSS